MTTLTRYPRPARSLLVAAGVTLVALLSGCGSGDDATVIEPGATGSSAPSNTAPSTATSDATDLTITVDDGNGNTTTSTLSCAADGTASGTHAKPEKACTVLAKNAATALPPVPAGGMCTQIYGGDGTAKITGTYLGKPVSSSFSLKNGCEISRWNALQGVLPEGGLSLNVATTEPAPMVRKTPMR